jgi:hypothetical protein
MVVAESQKVTAPVAPPVKVPVKSAEQTKLPLASVVSLPPLVKEEQS